MNDHIHKSGGFYDLEQIKQIPIMDVCQQMLDISVEKRGNNVWCKSRSERTASTILHPDQNTFYDFGSGTGGNVISFVSYVRGVEPATAISMLAEQFHIPCINQREGKNENYITDWEYKQIGLFGDRATKNFTWNFEHTSIDRMHEIEKKFSIPMNDLRVKFPKIYEQVLKKKALPYVFQLRNEYFLNIKSEYKLVCELGNSDAFNPEKYSKQIKDLIATEKIFARAKAGTSINFTPVVDYNPLKDLENIQKGLIKPCLGNTTKKELKLAASAAKTQVRYRIMDYGSYMASDIDKYNHTAFLKGDVVVVGFLASEYNQFRSFFEKSNGREVKQSLEEQIDVANKSKSSVSVQNHSKNTDLER